MSFREDEALQWVEPNVVENLCLFSSMEELAIF